MPHIRKFVNVSYRLVRSNGGPQRLEHRVVMEEHLGRPLRRDEVIHHKDGNGLNNELSNLELMSQAEHRRLHGGPRLWPLAEAIRLRESGMTMDAIAKRYGVTAGSVRNVFLRRGVSTEYRRTSKFDHDRARAMRAEGHPFRVIAETLGVSITSVRAVVNLGR